MTTLFSTLSSEHSQVPKSPVTQTGDSSEFVDGVKDPTSPKLTENLASPLLSDQMNTLFSTLSSDSIEFVDGVKNPTSPAVSVADTDISEPGVSPVTTDTIESVNGIQNQTLMVESTNVQSVNPSSTNASENGGPVQSMNPPSTNASENGSLEMLVEPSSGVRNSTVSKRGRPSGGRPMPTHMKIS
jgi:hypothetical protein